MWCFSISIPVGRNGPSLDHFSQHNHMEEFQYSIIINHKWFATLSVFKQLKKHIENFNLSLFYLFPFSVKACLVFAYVLSAPNTVHKAETSALQFERCEATLCSSWMLFRPIVVPSLMIVLRSLSWSSPFSLALWYTF